jgi:thiol-disulfide isomerase/thioredoxin
MTDARPTRLTLVMATWCPHCVPVSTERLPALAKRLGVPGRVLDIDVRDQDVEADRLVREFGRWDDDYVIPQLYLERSDGTAEALLVAHRGSPTSVTRQMWEALLADPEGAIRPTSP